MFTFISLEISCVTLETIPMLSIPDNLNNALYSFEEESTHLDDIIR